MFLCTVKIFSKFRAYPVFIADGTPSPLKSEVRILRYCKFCGIDLTSFPGLKEGVSIERNKTFLSWVQECVKFFKLLGVPVLEAEALCAELNRESHVYAYITPNSDTFLCGAKHVIRRFNCSKFKEPFECYHMSEIEAGLGLKRRHLIAISLLVGYDHDINGVQGIELDSAFQFVRAFSEDDNKLVIYMVSERQCLRFNPHPLPPNFLCGIS
ncbi:flap endonuclease GEN-like 1 [Gastrolobium bilobum]|uniref:flap endonuclease GEN-like 1 n=1 Tax=Gastrolobium bilobum TaxID=150636 RepID=UPI002AB1104B|nr:flap endonuclease GEN-like 1 [Gastrolobium bilobum]